MEFNTVHFFVKLLFLMQSVRLKRYGKDFFVLLPLHQKINSENQLHSCV